MMEVIMTVPTMAVKKSSLRMPIFRPTCAIINPTSPRLIIPTPSCSDSFQFMPPNLAPNPDPNTLPAAAISTTTTITHNILGWIWWVLMLSPIDTKNIGTKKTVREGMKPGLDDGFFGHPREHQSGDKRAGDGGHISQQFGGKTVNQQHHNGKKSMFPG